MILHWQNNKLNIIKKAFNSLQDLCRLIGVDHVLLYTQFNIIETIYKNKSSDSAEPKKNPNEFSTNEACQIKLGICNKIGILGHSLKMVLEKTHKCGNNSHKIIESLCDPESKKVLNLIKVKLRKLKEETHNSTLLAKFIQASIAFNTLFYFFLICFRHIFKHILKHVRTIL